MSPLLVVAARAFTAELAWEAEARESLLQCSQGWMMLLKCVVVAMMECALELMMEEDHCLPLLTEAVGSSMMDLVRRRERRGNLPPNGCCTDEKIPQKNILLLTIACSNLFMWPKNHPKHPKKFKNQKMVDI